MRWIRWSIFYARLKRLQTTFTEKNLIGTIITEGGTAPNIIPAKSRTAFDSPRALDSDYLENTMLVQIKELARQVAKEHAAGVQMRHYEPLVQKICAVMSV